MERLVELKNPSGLHARPASVFVREAGKFESEVSIRANGREVNAKSILGLLSLGLAKGSEIAIVTQGSDEQQALDTLCTLVESGLGEA